MADPQVHYIEYPLPPTVKCVKCFGEEGAGKVKGEYSDPPHLAKHLKKCHPGDTLNYKCKECGFQGTGRYPLKPVKEHYARVHGSPGGSAAGPSTRGNLGECSGAGQPRRATRATAPLAGAVGGAERRPPALSSTATPSPQWRRGTSEDNTPSPSYAAVTAGPSTRTSTTSTLARRAVAKSAAPNAAAAAVRRSGEADRAL
ncbi:hypothetical protein ALC56_08101 [Trachymyrmex septentrionalis]|uniref:Uncharacterized protein n=1 Tax=Trachymyrmex septentrionalis TaxID=34720 RepID=A0A151JVH1_9HYME|nr:hypothetical protein ALC56_08101 [Trachymyrmex septentrionalis]